MKIRKRKGEKKNNLKLKAKNWKVYFCTGEKEKLTFREKGEIGSKSKEEGEIGSENRENGDLPPCSTPLLSFD